MFVVIDKTRLQRLIAVTRDDRSARREGDQPFFRIEASGQSLRLTGKRVEVEVSATVHEPGVLFLRVTLFRRMLAMLPHKGFLSVQANEHGILVGDVQFSPEVVDMLLYPDPTTAPLLHPEERGDMPEQLSRETQPSLFTEQEQRRNGGTTRTGYENVNGQRNDGCLNLAGNDHNQLLYRMKCTKCSVVYAANGSDIHHRKCPKCQGGAPSSTGWTA